MTFINGHVMDLTQFEGKLFPFLCTTFFLLLPQHIIHG